MLYHNETWAVTAGDMCGIERREASMLHWTGIANVCIQQYDLRDKLGAQGIRCSVQVRRLYWYAHVIQMKTVALRSVKFYMQRECVEGVDPERQNGEKRCSDAGPRREDDRRPRLLVVCCTWPS